jgi:murein DD-endopeptidase MepM/ murein hydrolase activator NlpD
MIAIRCCFFVYCALFLCAARLFAEAPLVELAVFPETIRPGDPFVVAMALPSLPSGRPAAALADDKGNRLSRAVFFSLNAESRRGPVLAALLAVPATAVRGRALITVDDNGTTLGEIAVTIANRDFLSETIPLTAAMSDIVTRSDPQKQKEAERLWGILGRTGGEVFCTGNFVMPVASRVQTSRFGGRRVYRYPNGKTSISTHAGIDYRAPEGTPVTVCAPGKVAFAGPRIVTGNTVIIEHMPGVYSLCYHLSKISLAEGQTVGTGDMLGEAGSTGFSTAAHLHWEVRVAGENTDPEAFLGRNILDKDAIVGKLNE